MPESYVKAMMQNINDRFLSNILDDPGAFSMFHLEKGPVYYLFN